MKLEIRGNTGAVFISDNKMRFECTRSKNDAFYVTAKKTPSNQPLFKYHWKGK